MIKIFEHDSTVFTSLGLGDITKIVTKAQSVETLNGQYSLELDVVYDKWGKWKLLTNGRIIYADGQAFRIYATRKKQQGFTAYARHIFWDLMDNEVRDVRPTDKNAMAAMQDILGATNYAHNFTAFSDILTTNTQYYINRNPVDCLIGADSLRTRWGGELKLDNFEVSMLGQRGQDNGVSISYRKNMQDIDVEESYEGFITRMRPKGNNGLELPEIYIDSPYIGNYPHPVIREVSFFIDAADYSTQAEAEAALRAAANAYYTSTKCDIPAVSIDVDLILLENTTQYAAYRNLVTVALGDTVSCRHLDLEIDHTARVVKITKDLLTGKNAKVEIGQLKKRINNSFTRINNTINDLSAVVTSNKTSLQQAIDDATELLTSALGGYVIKRNGEILIMDTEDPATATKVWRWNLNGLGYSSGPGAINGPYGIAMTMDGKINASFITTGELDAAIIKVGSIEADKLSIAAKQVLFEMVDVGSRNLLLNSKVTYSTADYLINEYTLSTPLVEGQEYTFTVYGNKGTNRTFGIWVNAGGISVGNLTWFKYGTYFVTFTCPAITTGNERTIRLYNTPYTETSTSKVQWAKLESGNKPTDWTPAPEEMYSGITRIDKNGINVGVSTSEINTQLAYDGLRVFNGAIELASFGQSGAVVPNLSATTITGNVLNTLDSSVTLTVGSGYTYSTVSAALASLRDSERFIKDGSAIDIGIYSTISDDVLISGFTGYGSVNLIFYNGATLNGRIRVFDNNVRVTIIGSGRNGVIKRTAGWACIEVRNTLYCNVNGMNLNGNAGSYAFLQYYGGMSYVQSVDMIGVPDGICAQAGAVIFSENNKGNTTNTGVLANSGGLICIYGTIPNGANYGYATSGGHVILNGTPTETNSSFSPPASTPTVFVGTFAHANVYTVQHDTSTVDTYYGASACQNRWDSSMGWKDGVFTFGSDIYNYWQGGSNVLVEMRVRRKNSAHGSSGGVAPAPYNFSPSEAFNAVGRGIWTDWTTVPSSVFGSGGATLKFYNGVAGSAGYAIWDAAEVKVTVTKNV